MNRSTPALLALLLLVPAGAARADEPIEGYATPLSVVQGDTVRLHVSSTESASQIRILASWNSGVVATYPSVPTAAYAVPESAYAYGAGWPVTLAIPVPGSWVSGIYYAELLPAGHPLSDRRYCVFVVREDQPGSTSRILVQASSSTWNAYNWWGGKSLYTSSSSDHIRSWFTSLERPSTIFLGKSDYANYGLGVIKFLYNEGVTAEFCDSEDLDRDPSLLDSYDLFISTGHDEYWSDTQRDAVEAFIAGGGNAMFLSGNICWWRIRWNGSQEICYKDASLDPSTYLWDEAPANRPSNRLTAVNWRETNVGLPGSDYRAYRTNHWAYAGTGLQDGDLFGTQLMPGDEVDGLYLDWQNGLPFPAASAYAEGTPATTEILALAPALRYDQTDTTFAAMTLYTQGGTVFTGSYRRYGLDLLTCPVLAQVTRNVLAQLATRAILGTGPTLLGEVRGYPVPFRAGFNVEVTTDRDAPARLGIYDIQGRRVGALSAWWPQGVHTFRWDGGGVPRGVYFWRLEAGGATATGKAVRN